jgi:hypothetical protein
LRTEALAAIAVLALTLLSTLALAASPPSLASRTVAYLPYPQGLQTLPPYDIPASPLPPYGILLLFLGSSGSYLVMFNISNRDYKVIAHFGPNIVPYLSSSAPMLCLSNLSNGTGVTNYVAEVSPEGSISEEPLINGSYLLCTGLAEADGVIVASLLNFSTISNEVVVARQVGRSLEMMKSMSLPPGGMLIDLSPSPSGLLYGAYLEFPSSIFSTPTVDTIYPVYVNLSSGSLTILNRFNMTLTLSSNEFPWLDSSTVSSSLIIYGGVYVSVSPQLYTASSVQPILIYFNTSTYRLLNVSDLMPPASAVFGAYWSPWGILISDAMEAWGRRNISCSPHLFLKPWGEPWGGGLVNETGLAPGQLVLGGLEVKGSYYLVAVNITGRKVAIIEVYKKGLSWAYVIAPIVVIAVVIAAASLAVLLRRR